MPTILRLALLYLHSCADHTARTGLVVVRRAHLLLIRQIRVIIRRHLHLARAGERVRYSPHPQLLGRCRIHLMLLGVAVVFRALSLFINILA